MSDRICYFCKYRAPHNTGHEGHLRKHTKEKPFYCLQTNCYSSFAQQSGLNKHCKQVHKNLKSKERQKSSKNCYFCNFRGHRLQHMLRHTRERPYKCPFTKCRNFSISITARNQHTLMCEYNPNLKNNIQKREEFYRKVLIEGKFQCYFCLKNFGEKGNFFKHIRWHTEELSASCAGCKIQFNHRDIWKHRKVCVKSRQLFMCPFCNVSKTGTGELNNHIRNVHTKDDVKLICYFCNVSVLRNQMKEHIATHTQEKPSKCRYCSVSCVNNTSLKGHIASKHRDTEHGREIRNKLRRKCYVCHRCFASFERLRIHMACHTMESHTSRFS